MNMGKSFEQALLESPKGRKAICRLVQQHLGQERYALLTQHLARKTAYGMAYCHTVCILNRIGSAAEAALQLEYAGFLKVDGIQFSAIKPKPARRWRYMRPQAE